MDLSDMITSLLRDELIAVLKAMIGTVSIYDV
ncbi:Thiamin biosynthesis protein ThiC [Campylobacter lari]|nr:Thiamin biosynthesis protein ThiC [Campylobacter lari]VEJ07074.1 Thiamin biosynthesis protein ThiC [Campylobacter lari]